MSKRDGVLLINKPPHITSFKVLERVKRKLKLKKAGHGGTLDPFADGLLVILTGEATKIMDYIGEYKEYKGILTFSILSSSIVGNDFLVANPDYDFFINVTGRKTVSLRANGKVDVSMMAKELFGGGGHKNASGGKLKEFKSSFIYEKIFAQLQDIML